MKPMPPLANAATHMKSLDAFQKNQERERIAIAQVILRAIQQGTLGPNSPHAGKLATEFEE
jgi:hypothetical protein